MTLHRTTLRESAVAVLTARLPRGTAILVGQQWPLDDSRLPAVLLDIRRESKRITSVAGGEPRFVVSASLVVRARAVVVLAPGNVQDGTEHGPACEALLDLWIDRIQDALLSDPDFVSLFDAIPGVTVETQVASQEDLVVEAGLTFDLEWQERYAPRLPDDFASVAIRIDAIDPADRAGTYPPAPGFPNAAPAPRERGPDGRAEAGLTITLPTPD